MRVNRRQFISIAGLSLLSGCSALSDSPSNTVETRKNWRMFNGDAKHTGYTPEQTIPESVSSQWMSGALPNPTTSPIVADRTLVLCTDTGVRAYPLEDESPEWQTPLDAKPGGTPAIHGNRVFITEDDRHGNQSVASVRALDLGTGKTVWERSLDASAVLAPSVTENGVFVRTDTGLVSLARSSGDVQWSKSELGRFENLYYDIAADISPAVLDDRVVFPSGDGLVTVEIGSGEELWRTSAQKVRSAPSSDGQRVYYSDIVNGVRAVSAESGETEWRYDATGCWTTPAVGDGRVVATTGFELASLDVGSGEEQWTSESLLGDIYTSPVIAADRIVVGSIDTSAAAVSKETGEVRWRYGQGTRRSPALSGGTVFAVGRYDGVAGRGDKTVVALE